MPRKKLQEVPEGTLVISKPDIQKASFKIVGTTPYVQCKFSQKAREEIEATQSRKGTKSGRRDAKDFDEAYRQALHVSEEGWYGIPAPAFRAGMISACRIIGFAMTQAKLALFVLQDGFDSDEGTPLVKITKGEPTIHKGMVRLPNGSADVRWRPMWAAGWEAIVTVQFDAGMFSAEDVANLFIRVGLQVGVGEGRPDSKKSAGMGWGTFMIA